MSHSTHSTSDTTAATQQPATWLRPSLTVLPPLRDLTLQSGVSAAAVGGSFGGTSSLLSFGG